MNHTTAPYWLRASLLMMLCAIIGSTSAAAPSPAQLIAQMEEALTPAQPQLARVHISVTKELTPDESLSWEALVARQRFDDGPRTAITILEPDYATGSAMLTAPRTNDKDLGLWLYTPKERRARQIAPLEPDRNLLLTDFGYADLGLAPRDLIEAELVGEEVIDGQATWKVRAAPEQDWYYSYIVTWIAQDTMLPVKREFYDRADRLWKVLSVRSLLIDSVPTVLDVTLEDVQTRSTSRWQVRAVSYDAKGLDKQDLSPDSLGQLAAQPFWKIIGVTPLKEAVSTAN
ncbi:MAG: outer membrane lipoprotein-sorting protein [Gammaproteobacteria bacterium]